MLCRVLFLFLMILSLGSTCKGNSPEKPVTPSDPESEACQLASAKKDEVWSVYEAASAEEREANNIYRSALTEEQAASDTYLVAGKKMVDALSKGNTMADLLDNPSYEPIMRAMDQARSAYEAAEAKKNEALASYEAAQANKAEAYAAYQETLQDYHSCEVNQ